MKSEKKQIGDIEIKAHVNRRRKITWKEQNKQT